MKGKGLRAVRAERAARRQVLSSPGAPLEVVIEWPKDLPARPPPLERSPTHKRDDETVDQWRARLKAAGVKLRSANFAPVGAGADYLRRLQPEEKTPAPSQRSKRKPVKPQQLKLDL